MLCQLLFLSAHADDSLDCLIEPHLVVDLSSPEIGVLGSVMVDEADVVRAGDVLAALRDDVERAALELSRTRAAAHAEIELLRQDHEFNSRKRSRIDQLEDKFAVSTQNADEVRTAEDLARLRLRAATEKQKTARLEAARDALALDRRTVRSPINGVVAKRYKTAGEYVEGDPIVQLVQLDPLRVQVVAPIEMFGQISVGMRATVLPELPVDGAFEARVTSIDPVMDAATATFGVRLSLPNPDQKLPPGLKCTIVLHDQTGRVAEADAGQPKAPETPARPSLRAAPKTPVGHGIVAETQAVAPRANQCTTVGPLNSDVEADAIVASLAASDVDSQRRLTGAEVKAKWLVLSAAAESPNSVLVGRIKQANIGDFQLLSRGDWRNRVSFGTYQARQSALRRVKQIRELGFEAEIVNREHANASTWLDLTLSPNDPRLEQIVSSRRDNGSSLTVQPIPCTQLASR